MWSSTLQINWKQRFFVPTDEEPGIAILAALLEQFPVIATEDEEADCYAASDHGLAPSPSVQPIDLETWTIETDATHNDEGQQPAAMMESESEPMSDPSESACTHSNNTACLLATRHAIATPILLSLPPDHRTPAVQIGFNFADS